MRLRHFVAACSLSLLPAFAHAASFTYNVDLNYPTAFTPFSIVGTITTDTDSGAVTTSDITAFSLTYTGVNFKDASDTQTLTNTDASETVYSVPCGVGCPGILYATPDGLFFNFGLGTPADGDSFFIASKDNNVGITFFSTGAFVYDDPNGGQVGNVYNLTDAEEIATIATPTSVTPEPNSLVLLGTGLLGAVGFVRRKARL